MGLVSRKRGFCRGKKANIMHEIYFFIFQLVLVFIVLISLLQYINIVSTDLGFEKRFVSIDISLLTTAMFYSPGIIRYDYSPLTFWQKDRFTPVEAKFADSEVAIKEIGKELETNYWYLSDLTMDEFIGTTRLEGAKTTVAGIDLKVPRIISFFKAGKDIEFQERNTNAYQLVCPVINTTTDDWQSKQVFVAKVATKTGDLSDRISRLLAAQYPRFTMSSSSQPGSTETSAIPSSSDLVVTIGDSGSKEPGSLVVYIPIDDSIMKSRKLACLIINHLLTTESAVLYAQIMPVTLSSIPSGSPLGIFKEKKPGQAMVFIDIGRFGEDQVNIAPFAQAMEEAVQHYYGKRTKTPVSAATISVSSTLMQASKTASSPATLTSGSVVSNIKPFGPVVDNIQVSTDWGETTLNPSQVCPPGRCENRLFKGFQNTDKVNPRKILVIHSTSGGSRTATSNFFINRFRCRCLGDKRYCSKEWLKYLETKGKKCARLSVHYIVGRDGIYDYLAPENIPMAHAPGHHNGMNVNSNSIGIETANAEYNCKKICTGKVCPPSVCKTISPEQLATLTTAEKNVWGAGYFTGRYLRTRTYEEVQPKQMLALITLSAEIMIRYQIPLDNVIRHLDATMSYKHIPKNAHGDPHAMFPWREFQANLAKMIEQYNQKAGSQTGQTGAMTVAATTSTGSSTGTASGGTTAVKPTV